MGRIKVAIAGVGNCASSLVQGVEHYKNAREDEFVPGLMHVNFGGYHIRDIEFVAAFDVDANKVGKDLAEAIKAGCGFINCIPEFIVSDREWGRKFEEAGLPCAGDDIKSQVGATILHRTLTKLLIDRGVKVEESYQLNIGGNTDFLNMLEEERLSSKRVSKTEAVSSQIPYEVPLRIGPSDYVPFLKDRKICYIYIRGKKFGDVPLYIDVKLNVEDSPNSAGVVIDAIRAVKLALDRGTSGPLTSVSAYFFKHPPVQMPDEEARRAVEEFIAGKRDR